MDKERKSKMSSDKRGHMENHTKLDKRIMDGHQVYENTENQLKIRFYCQPDSILVQLKKDEYIIEIEKTDDVSLIAEYYKRKHLSDQKDAAQILYRGYADNADLEYLFDGDSLKENILVYRQAESYRYSLRLRTGNLFPQLLSDGSIVLKTQDTNQAVFTFPAPYMFDSAGLRSDAVSYILEMQGQGVYLLCVEANAAWINNHERQFPVTIDPTVFLQDRPSEGSCIEMMQFYKDINNDGTTKSSEICYDGLHRTPPIRYLQVGGSYGDRLWRRSRIYFRFHSSLKTFFSDKQIDQVTFGLTKFGTWATAPNKVEDHLTWLRLHEYTGRWPTDLGDAEAFDNDQFKAKPLFAFKEEEYVPGQSFAYDITGYFRSWLKGEGTGKLVLRSAVEDGKYDYMQYGSNAIFTRFMDGNTLEGPFLQISYRHKTGLKGGKSLPVNCGRAGSAVVDLFTGGLSLMHEALSLNGDYNVPQLQLIYSSDYEGRVVDPKWTCGKGWKLNIQQTLEKRAYQLGHTSIEIWEYMDAAGIVHPIQPQYYYEIAHGDEKVKQTVLDEHAIQKHKNTEGGIGLIEELRAGQYLFNETERTLTDEVGNKLYFNAEGGRLSKWYDKAKELTVEIEYSDYILHLTFNHRSCDIYFSTEGLSEIHLYNISCVYQVTEGLLTKCLFKKNGQEENASQFVYMGDRLNYVIDRTGAWTKFNYAWLSSPETNLSSYMVSEIRFGTSVTRIGYADNDCGGALKKAPQEALNQTDSHLQIEYAHLHSLKTKIKKDNAFIAEYTFNRSGMLLLEEDAFGARKVSTAETLDMLYLDDYKQMREVNLSRISQAVVHPEAVNYVEEAVAAGPTSYKGRINLVSYSATEPETCFYVFSCEIKCSGAQLPTLRDRIAREELTKKFELYVEPRRGLYQFTSPDPSNEGWQFLALVVKANQGLNEFSMGFDSTDKELTYQLRNIRLQKASAVTQTICEKIYSIADDGKHAVKTDLTPMSVDDKRYVATEYELLGDETVSAEVDELNRPVRLTDVRERQQELIYDKLGLQTERLSIKVSNPAAHIEAQYVETFRTVERSSELNTTYNDADGYKYNIFSDLITGGINAIHEPIANTLERVTRYNYDTQKNISQSAADRYIQSIETSVAQNSTERKLTTTNYYYNKGLLTKAEHEGGKVEIEYDGYGRPLQVKYNDACIRKFAYISGSQITGAAAEGLTDIANIECVTEVRSSVQSITHASYYDKYGRLRMVRLAENKENWQAFTAENNYLVYQYNENGRLLSAVNRVENTKEIYLYNDLFEVIGSETQTLADGTRIVRSETKQTQTAENAHIVTNSIYVGAQATAETYTIKYDRYRSDPRMTQVEQPDGNVIAYQYNDLGFLTEKKGLGNRPIEQFSYTNTFGGQIENSQYVRMSPAVYVKSYGNIRNSYLRMYERDAAGNIKQINEMPSGIPIQIVSYQYDEMGRLAGENRKGGDNYTCTYDVGGNLLIKNGKTYRYNTQKQLIGYGGSTGTINYTIDGKPDKWFDHNQNDALAATLSWGKEGNLSNYQATGKDVSYRYDSYGLRTEKSVDGKVHRYIYQGGMLLREWRGDIQIEYLYDLEGITGLKYNNKAYYFVKSLQGDVDRIYNENRYMVAEYIYDAWGAHSVVCYDENGALLSSPPSEHVGLVNQGIFLG